MTTTVDGVKVASRWNAAGSAYSIWATWQGRTWTLTWDVHSGYGGDWLDAPEVVKDAIGDVDATF